MKLINKIIDCELWIKTILLNKIIKHNKMLKNNNNNN